MKKYDKKLLQLVPPDYYHEGIRKNLLQRIWHKKKWEMLHSLLPVSSGRIVEVGCAAGLLTGRIKQTLPKADVIGIDLYDKAIALARKKYPNVRFICADAHALPLTKNSIDVVVAVETLEHLHDPDLAVKEIYRILKPKGTFILGQDTDSAMFRLIWWFWTKMKGKIWQDVHVSCMNPDELEAMLRKHGFAVKKKVFSHWGLEVFLQSVKKT